MRILLVEDEIKLAQAIRNGLVEAGFSVDQAFDGEVGQDQAETEDYDAIILDLGLPKIDGVTLCKNLRRHNIVTPILMLTARSRTEDKVAGLDSGADDYLTKPFEMVELRSRLQALIRRSYRQQESQLKCVDLLLDPAKHNVIRSNKQLELSPKEFAVLEFLMLNKNHPVTRQQIMDHVWDYDFSGLSNVVDVFIAGIRRKVDAGSNQKLVKTVHGVGYEICDVFAT